MKSLRFPHCLYDIGVTDYDDQELTSLPSNLLEFSSEVTGESLYFTFQPAVIGDLRLANVLTSGKGIPNGSWSSQVNNRLDGARGSEEFRLTSYRTLCYKNRVYYGRRENTSRALYLDPAGDRAVFYLS